MKKSWSYISRLGIGGKEEGLERLSLILTNQINFIVGILMLLILAFLRVIGFIEDAPPGVSSLRVLALLVLSVINILLSGFRKHSLTKFSLIVFPPVVFLLMPTFIGFVEEESFTYYPYAIIAFSIIPQLLLIPHKQQSLYWFSLAYYFVLLMVMDALMMYFAPDGLLIIDRIKSFYTYYKLSHVVIFIFIHTSVYYLRKLNIEYESQINAKKRALNKQNQELHQALDDLKLAQDQLLQSEKLASLGTLTAGVAHELNNPLNFISGGASIIREMVNEHKLTNKPIDVDKVEENINVIDEGVDRSNKILSSLLTFSFQGKSEKKEADVHHVIESVLTFLNSKISNEIRIKKYFRLEEPVPMFEDKFHQVLVNIIDNAIYALKNPNGQENKTIEIFTHLAERNHRAMAVLKILNSGPAIPEQKIKNIFDPFFTTKDVGQGNGLGLSISYNLVAEHDGNIFAENTDMGVCFTIELPLKNPGHYFNFN
jgi:signal transduction histidine kinase